MRTVLGETAPTLDDLVQNPSLEEVWINGPDQVFVAERGVSRAVPMSLSAIEIRVRQSASEFLQRVSSEDLDGVLVESAHTPDGWHAEVTLSSVWSPPLVSEFFPDSLRIRVEARAQTFLR